VGGKDVRNLLIGKRSCYAGNPGEWRIFIKNWKEKIPLEHSDYSIVKDISFNDLANFDEKIIDAEKRLGILLPDSYKDFLRAITIPPGLHPSNEDFFDFSGFLNVNYIDWMGGIDGDYFNVIQGFDFHENEGEYFSYGVDFSFDHLSTGFGDFLMVIAKIDVSEYLLLNTKFHSSDGEFEAAYLTPSSIVRYPNFAEMMRQFAAIDCSLVDNIGPASQISLNKIDWIGGKLISDPWWR